MANKAILILLIVFVVGWATNSLASIYLASNTEMPVYFSLFGQNKNTERESPADHIEESQIHVYEDRVVVDVDNTIWAKFTDTNSMDPILDINTNSVEIIPKSPDEVSKGDVISFNSNYADGIIIHRVIEIGNDNQGWYAITKGDNNPSTDPGKLRFNQIKGIVVMLIY